MQLTEDLRALLSVPETETAHTKLLDYLSLKLAFLPCQVSHPTESSLCAFFDFGGEHTVAFTSDTRRGHRHCLAMLLAFGRNVAAQKPKNNILLIFQSREETFDLCQSGLFRKHRVAAVFSLTLWPGLAPGAIATRKNEMFSRACEIRAEITGKPSHIADNAGQDALAAAVMLYNRAQELEKSLPESVYRLLKFTSLSAPASGSALPSAVVMTGTLRTFQDDTYNDLRAKLSAIARVLQEETGCKVDLTMSDGCPAVLNPPELYDRIYKAVPFQREKLPSMHTNAFGHYQRYVPGMLFFLGVGNEPEDFDRGVLEKGVEFFQMLAERY